MGIVVTFYFFMIMPGREAPVIYDEKMSMEECIGNVATFSIEARRSLKSKGQFQIGCKVEIPETMEH